MLNTVASPQSRRATCHAVAAGTTALPARSRSWADEVRREPAGSRGERRSRDGAEPFSPRENLGIVVVHHWGIACGGRDRLPLALRRFFDRALAAAPASRFQSAHEFRAALDGLATQPAARAGA